MFKIHLNYIWQAYPSTNKARKEVGREYAEFFPQAYRVPPKAAGHPCGKLNFGHPETGFFLSITRFLFIDPLFRQRMGGLKSGHPETGFFLNNPVSLY
jgi:hypothetical protein